MHGEMVLQLLIYKNTKWIYKNKMMLCISHLMNYLSRLGVLSSESPNYEAQNQKGTR